MIVIYIISAMFTAGCIGLPLWATAALWSEGEVGTALGALLIGFPVGVLLGTAPWALIEHAQSPDLVTLKKTDWHCTATHQETTMVLAGKVMVPQTRSVCDQYGKI